MFTRFFFIYFTVEIVKNPKLKTRLNRVSREFLFNYVGHGIGVGCSLRIAVAHRRNRKEKKENKLKLKAVLDSRFITRGET